MKETNSGVNAKQTSTILGAEGISVEKPKICVVGIGGAGCNTIRRLAEMGVADDVDLIAINTDIKQLRVIENPRIKRILVGAKLTGGQGAGGYPEIGEEAAVASNHDIAQALEGARIVFVSAGMGGGTGTGAAPVVAKIAREIGAVVISVVTFPFRLERARVTKAKEGIKKLKQESHTVIVLDNNLLVEYAPNIPMDEAFKIADEVIGKAIDGITHSILIPSLINLDFADFMAIMETGGMAMISVGYGAGPKKIEEAVEAVKKQPLLKIDTSGAKGALVHITGGKTLSLSDANKAGEMLTRDISQNAPVIWGARVDEKMGDEVEVVLIMTGVKTDLLSEESISTTKSTSTQPSVEGSKYQQQTKPTHKPQKPPWSVSGHGGSDTEVKEHPQPEQQVGYGYNQQPGYNVQPQANVSQQRQQPGYGYTQQPGYNVQPQANVSQQGYGTQPGYGYTQQPGYNVQPQANVSQQGYGTQQPEYISQSKYQQPPKPPSRQRPEIVEDAEELRREQEEIKNILGAEGVNLEEPKIVVVGVGGGGCNSITRLSQAGLSKTALKSTRLVAVNTDKRALIDMVKEGVVPITKVLIGGKLTRGMGAGGFPEVGKRAAEESYSLLQQVIGNPQLVFLTMGMGGGTGTGAGPVIAKIAKEAGAIVLGIVTYPFALERARKEKAKEGIANLMQYCDSVIVIDNEKLREVAPNMPMVKAFMFADSVIQDAVQGITETIMAPSLINLDFADIQAVMGKGEISLICVGEGEGPDKVKEAIESTLNKPLLDVDYSDISGALIHITGGPNMTLDDVNKIGYGISKGVRKNANVVWGARIDENLGDKIKVVAILTGVKGTSIPIPGRRGEYIPGGHDIWDEVGIKYI